MTTILHAAVVMALVCAFAAAADANGNHHNNCPPHHPNPPSLACDAGGPYNVDASVGIVTVQLDGTDSFGATSWAWSTNHPGAIFDDPTLPNPILSIPVTCDCSFNLQVRLTVKRQQQTKSCTANVRLRDRTPPTIVCPENAKLICGDPTSPAALGFATATDNCDQNVHITYKDKIIKQSCDATRFDHVIQRTWKAVDNDCNVSKCIQLIDVVKVVASLDILPGACPNLYDRSSNALLPIAILGAPGFDVTQIQWNTVKMYGLDCDGGPVKAHSYQLSDAATPFIGQGCGCHDLNGDGQLDLVAKFKRNKVNNRFDLCDVPPGTAIEIIVVGRLCDGCEFIAQDCIVVQ